MKLVIELLNRYQKCLEFMEEIKDDEVNLNYMRIGK